MDLLRYVRRHRKDDDRPYAIGGAAGVLAFVILALFALAVTDRFLMGTGNLAAVISSTLVSLANGDRAANDLPALSVSPLLVQVAQAKANDMAAYSYFAHTSPSGKDPWYWYKQEGYSFLYAGENLAVDFNDSINVNSAWMNSPEHRANLLDEHYTEIGIATAQGTFEGHPTTFVVEEFGTPSYTAVQTTPVKVTEPKTPTEPAVATTEKPSAAQTAGMATTSVSSTSPIALTTPAVSTSTATATAPVLGVSATAPAPTGSLLAHAITSPLTALRYAYYLLGVLVLLLLAYVTRFELKQHHMHHVYAAASLLVLMAVLFTFANFVLFGHPVLAAGLR